MIEKHYKIIFPGKVAQGRETEEVKRNLKSLLKLSDENVKKLFTGKKVIIKKNAEYNEAMKYKMAFETAGAICVIEEITGEQPKPITQQTTSDSKDKWESKPSKAMTCPHCGFEQEEANECSKCGIIINKHSKKSENPPPLDLYMASEAFFSVSKTKLIVMSLFSWGIYEIYWFYKNWKLIQERTEKKFAHSGELFSSSFSAISFLKQFEIQRIRMGYRSVLIRDRLRLDISSFLLAINCLILFGSYLC